MYIFRTAPPELPPSLFSLVFFNTTSCYALLVPDSLSQILTLMHSASPCVPRDSACSFFISKSILDINTLYRTFAPLLPVQSLLKCPSQSLTLTQRTSPCLSLHEHLYLLFYSFSLSKSNLDINARHMIALV
jgi:hypothetical protein